MKIAVIGLGLIGGSLVKTIRAHTSHTVYGADTNPEVFGDAIASGAIDAALTDKLLAECDIVAVALFPGAIIRWLKDNAAKLNPGTVVFDCGGIKGSVCETGFALAKRYGFTFFGGHPMAGTEHFGWSASRNGLFDHAFMILIPPDTDCAAEDALLEKFFLSLGFRGVTRTTAEIHDRTIAYTSQLAHIVSSSYIKSPTAQNYVGFSAGSFKDMTRVAFLNEVMWTELFLDNRDFLGEEIDRLIAHLAEYRNALAAGDAEQLKSLLAEGRELKLLSDRQGMKESGED